MSRTQNALSDHGYDPRKITHAGDALNRGIAMVNTVWLALQRAEDDDDYSAAIDTLYEARRKLVEAEDLIGLYRKVGGR